MAGKALPKRSAQVIADPETAEVDAMLKELRSFTRKRYGPRCKAVEPGCQCCGMWALYDLYCASAT